MKLPRLILNPAVGVWIRLWQQERRLSAQLRRERDEWANKFLQLKGVQPLFTIPEKVEVKERPPVGQIEKNRRLAARGAISNNPTAEEVLGVR